MRKSKIEPGGRYVEMDLGLGFWGLKLADLLRGVGLGLEKTIDDYDVED